VNFTCDQLQENTKYFTYLSNTCYYTNFNFTSNYFICECPNFIGSSSDFYLNFNIIDFFFYLDERFKFITYYEVFQNLNNLVGNYAFFCSVGVAGLYFIIILLFSCCDCYYSREAGLISYLEKQIIKLALPYLKNYNFKSNLNISKDDMKHFHNLERIEVESKFEKKIPASMNVDIIEVNKLNELNKLNDCESKQIKEQKAAEVLELDADLMDFDQLDYNVANKDYLKPHKKESELELEEKEKDDILTLGKGKGKTKNKKNKRGKKLKLFSNPEEDEEYDNEKNNKSVKSGSASERQDILVLMNKHTKNRKVDNELYKIKESIEKIRKTIVILLYLVVKQVI